MTHKTKSKLTIAAIAALTALAPTPSCAEAKDCVKLHTGESCGSGKICNMSKQCSAQCSGESPCDSGMVCWNGVCEPKCDHATTCASGMTCTSGVCAPKCDDASGCESGMTCSLTLSCVPRCDDGKTCGQGMVCFDGGCVAKCDDKTPCSAGAVCGLGNQCVALCEDSSYCAGDAVCAHGMCSPRCGAKVSCSGDSDCSEGGCVARCDSKSRCGAGTECVDGICVAGCVGAGCGTGGSGGDAGNAGSGGLETGGSGGDGGFETGGSAGNGGIDTGGSGGDGGIDTGGSGGNGGFETGGSGGSDGSGADAQFCNIDGSSIGPGVEHPENECEWCNPWSSKTQWTVKAKGFPCADDKLTCTVNFCDGAGKCAQSVFDGCLIGGKCVSNRQIDPSNECFECNPILTRSEYSLRMEDELCGSNSYCDAMGACKPMPDETCFIAGDPYPHGTRKPGSECMFCDTRIGTTFWSPLSNGAACDDDGMPWTSNHCVVGQCVSVLPPDVCVIDGIPWAPGEREPSNECRVCDPHIVFPNFVAQPDLLQCEETSDWATIRVCIDGHCVPAP